MQFAAIRVDPSPPPVRDSGPSTAPQKQSNSRLLAVHRFDRVRDADQPDHRLPQAAAAADAARRAVASSFTVASQIPNMISELVLGAVLTAIVVPVLVRAEREDPDQGAAFVRRLFTATLRAARHGGAARDRRGAAADHPRLPVRRRQGRTRRSPRLCPILLLPAILFYGTVRAAHGDPQHPAGVQTRRLGAGAEQRRVLAVLAIYWLCTGGDLARPGADERPEAAGPRRSACTPVS